MYALVFLDDRCIPTIRVNGFAEVDEAIRTADALLARLTPGASYRILDQHDEWVMPPATPIMHVNGSFQRESYSGRPRRTSYSPIQDADIVFAIVGSAAATRRAAMAPPYAWQS